ncbi:hypothetical protein HMI55_007210, partial [Coelomomyces lativittatus]
EVLQKKKKRKKTEKKKQHLLSLRDKRSIIRFNFHVQDRSISLNHVMYRYSFLILFTFVLL